MKTHLIKPADSKTALHILEADDGTAVVSVLNDVTGKASGVSLNRGQQIALAFAAIGGGTIDLSDEAARITDTLGSTGGDLTDDDLTVVARRALRVLANRRKKRASEGRHVDAILDASRGHGKFVITRAYATELVRAGIRAVDAGIKTGTK